MAKKLGRAFNVLGLTVLLTVIAWTPRASAASNLKAECFVSGKAWTDPTIALAGGKVAYTFGTLGFVCVATEDLTKPALVAFDTTSWGTFKNTVCGTGKIASLPGQSRFHGQTFVGVLSPKTSYAAFVSAMSYEIEVNSFAGIFYWTNGAGKVEAPKVQDLLTGDLKGRPPHAHDLGGIVQFDLANTQDKPPPPGACTKAFQIFGIVSIDTI